MPKAMRFHLRSEDQLMEDVVTDNQKSDKDRCN